MAVRNPKVRPKCESKMPSFESIKCDISPEHLPSLGKESLKQYCKELGLKVTGKKQELVERLAPQLGKLRRKYIAVVKLLNSPPHLMSRKFLLFQPIGK